MGKILKHIITARALLIFGAALAITVTSSVCLAGSSLLIGGGRISEQPDGSQLVFDLDQRPVFNAFALANPPRYVIDVQNAQLVSPINKRALRSQDVIRVRTGLRPNRDLRIVMDLRAPIRGKVTLVREHNYHLVVDFFRFQKQIYTTHKPRQRTPEKLQLTSSDLASTQRRKIIRKASSINPQRQQRKTPITIAIDAGHGGRWPGAVGPGGTVEKVLTLQIATRLAKLIDGQKGIRTCLTRNSDKHFHRNLYRDLYQRINHARETCKADLFVSLHADAYFDAEAHGASVYILSTKGASSASARWLAKHENETNAEDNLFKVEDEQIRKVLIEMVQDAALVESEQLGKHILNKIKDIAKLHSNKIESANFTVLKAPDIPSVLVETGFISNPAEERKLNDPDYQQTIAESIYQGIRDYLRQRPQLWPPEFIAAR